MADWADACGAVTQQVMEVQASKYMETGKQLGFTNAAIVDVTDLIVVPVYRHFCEENLCGNFGKLAACPPKSGTVDEMEANMRRYKKALVLQMVVTPKDIGDKAEQKVDKKRQNELTEQLMNVMRADGRTDLLMMGAGPWKDSSCLSAYCVDAQRLADLAGMKCWEKDGKVRYFSLVLFNP